MSKKDSEYLKAYTAGALECIESIEEWLCDNPGHICKSELDEVMKGYRKYYTEYMYEDGELIDAILENIREVLEG